MDFVQKLKEEKDKIKKGLNDDVINNNVRKQSIPKKYWLSSLLGTEGVNKLFDLLFKNVFISLESQHVILDSFNCKESKNIITSNRKLGYVNLMNGAAIEVFNGISNHHYEEEDLKKLRMVVSIPTGEVRVFFIIDEEAVSQYRKFVKDNSCFNVSLGFVLVDLESNKIILLGDANGNEHYLSDELTVNSIVDKGYKIDTIKYKDTTVTYMEKCNSDWFKPDNEAGFEKLKSEIEEEAKNTPLNKESKKILDDIKSHELKY